MNSNNLNFLSKLGIKLNIIENTKDEMSIKDNLNRPYLIPNTKSTIYSSSKFDSKLAVDSLSFESNTKEEILQNFLYETRGLFKQGTDGWRKQREKTIGGSEIGILLGSTGSIKELLLSKSGKKKFLGSHQTMWGTMFEDSLRTYLELENDIKIYETGCIIGEYRNSYSPDGLSVLNDKITLFEFKCPFSRVIGSSNIPKQYTEQVLYGLDTIKMTEIGLYNECMIRRCQLLDLGTKVYDKELNKDIEEDYRDTLAYGIIGIFSSDPIMNKEFKDFGSVSSKDFISLLYKLLHKELFFYSPTLYLVNDSNSKGDNIHIQLNNFYSFCKTREYHSVGIIPYKIVGIYKKEIKKEEGFVFNHKPLIDDFFVKLSEFQK